VAVAPFITSNSSMEMGPSVWRRASSLLRFTVEVRAVATVRLRFALCACMHKWVCMHPIVWCKGENTARQYW